MARPTIVSGSLAYYGVATPATSVTGAATIAVLTDDVVMIPWSVSDDQRALTGVTDDDSHTWQSIGEGGTFPLASGNLALGSYNAGCYATVITGDNAALGINYAINAGAALILSNVVVVRGCDVSGGLATAIADIQSEIIDATANAVTVPAAGGLSTADDELLVSSCHTHAAARTLNDQTSPWVASANPPSGVAYAKVQWRDVDSADTGLQVTWADDEGDTARFSTFAIVFTGAAGGADETAPTLSSPTDTATGSTTGSGGVDTDEGNGTLYWVVTTSATSPSAAQVKAGNDHTGSAAVDSGSQAVSGTGTQAISGGFTGLTAETTYYAHYMHEDAATNQSTVASADGFTTSAASGSALPIILQLTIGS